MICNTLEDVRGLSEKGYHFKGSHIPGFWNLRRSWSWSTRTLRRGVQSLLMANLISLEVRMSGPVRGWSCVLRCRDRQRLLTCTRGGLIRSLPST